MVASDRPAEESIERIRAEYLEMPGLCLTRHQVRRMWRLDRGVCDAVLRELLASGFLRRRGDNTFVRAE